MSTASKTTLFDLTSEQIEINAKVEAGELAAEDVADHLEANKAMIDDKIADYCRLETKFASEQVAIENEIARLQELLERKKRQRTGLMENLQAAMESIEMDSFDVGLYRGKIHKGRESVVVEDLDALPPEFVESKVTFRPDKKAIKAAIETGTLIAGARIDRAKGKLVIK